MSCAHGPVSGPFGLDAGKGETCRYQRTALAVVHHLTAATRLSDVMPLLEADRRIQVVYTAAPGSLFGAGVAEYLGRIGASAVPWCQVTQIRFDLAVAASYGSLERLHAPVLTVSHGVGTGKLTRQWDGPGPEARREGAGAARARLVSHGRVVPAAIAVATGAHRAYLERACPEAAPLAVVAGDPCFDRLAASLPWRESYRAALGSGGRTLVAVSSTWGTGSLFNQHPGLLPRLAAELSPSEYQIAAILHPGIWAWHGRRQVLAWYGECLRRGVVIVPPEEGWRAVLAAADVVIGDHGSVSCYAAAAGKPVLLAAFPRAEIEPGTPPAALGETAPRLGLGKPLAPQLATAARGWPASAGERLAAMITDAPGQSARVLRSVMYRLMGLPEPASAPEVSPVPAATRIAVEREVYR